ncbi:MAG: hypothetical protein A2166_01910 [Omnitrophica WOR_2 bacterium RBG_13_41_10]|nr:MAG: hypothetical protein A2166_01910 [Omnitrophica WOR_2 bacterium RBG_13_41_10]
MYRHKERQYQVIIAILTFLVLLESIFILSLLRPKAKKIPPVSLAPVIIKGKIAIVIDDWGYNLHNLSAVERIKYPITASILPNINYSKRAAQELHQKGLEIILHLPMEPHEKYRLEENTIMTSMDETTIRGILEKDLADISYAKGVSNHMGSFATEDPRTVEIIFKELKKRKLYFLDSVVSSYSVASSLAKKLGVAFIQRSVFLDNEDDPVYIRSQIYKLKTKAKLHGSAVGIGHDRKVTLEVLNTVMPELEKEGYRFVFVSDLVK